MTIRFLQQWNGYNDQSIASLGSTEEARLVGLGIATYRTRALKSGPVFDDLADMLPASEFVGVAQVGNLQLTSDGISYIDQFGNYYHPKHKPGFVLIGDSTLALGNVGGAVTSITATIGGTTATCTSASHGLLPGAVFVMQNANEPEFNGVFECVSWTSTSIFTYTLASPATVTAATGVPVLVNQQRIYDKETVSVANALAGAPCLYLGNFAQGGSKSEHLNRQLDLALDKTKNLWGREADYIFCSVGVNDAADDILSTVTVSNILSAIDRVYAAGKRLVLFTGLPWGAAHANWTVSRLQEHLKTSEHFRQLAKTDKRFILFDAWEYCVDKSVANSEYIATYSADNIHPDKPASWSMALPLKSQLFDKIKYVDDRVLVSVFTNAALSGVAGTNSGTGGSGDVADGFIQNTAGGGAQTAVGSKGTAKSGATEAQRIALTAAAASDSVEFYKDMHTLITAGKRYIAIAKIRKTGADNIKDLPLQIFAINGGNSGFGVMEGSGTYTQGADNDLTLETPPIKFVVGSTRFRPYIRQRASAAGVSTIDIAEFDLLQID